jgi:effector-binding domain-containing protein
MVSSTSYHAAGEPVVVEVAETPTAVVRGVVPFAELAGFFDRSFRDLGETLGRQRVTPAGPAFGLYHGPPDGTVDLEVGFPVASAVEPDGDVVTGALPGGRVARVVHAGGFEGLGEAWGRLEGWIRGQGLTPGGVLWEVYVTEPSPDMDPADLRTELNWTLGE